MDYIFGKRIYDGQEVEFVKTVADAYTDFPAGRFMSCTYDNGLINITNEFRVLRKFKEEVDLQGKYNTWYYIDNHNRTVDNSSQVNAALSNHTAQLIDQSEAIDDIIIALLGGE